MDGGAEPREDGELGGEGEMDARQQSAFPSPGQLFPRHHMSLGRSNGWGGLPTSFSHHRKVACSAAHPHEGVFLLLPTEQLANVTRRAVAEAGITANMRLDQHGSRRKE